MLLRLLKTILLFAALLLGLLLHFRNNDIVVLDFFIGSLALPAFMLFALAVLFGSVLGMGACLLYILQRRRQGQGKGVCLPKTASTECPPGNPG